jgi:ubiquinone biosynthesis protein
MKLPLRLPLPWRAAATAASTIPLPDIVHPMSRREVSHSVDSAVVTLPRARPPVTFKPGILRPISRLLVWIGVLVRFYSGNFADAVRGQASVERRAVRLRQAFEVGGPTFAKLAQQLSMRADMLPYPYCVELSKMLDQASAFPTEQAIEIIERSVGRPLTDIFDAFDPKPIGSASLACVFQAQLKSGERVAVKVRRPGIGPLIAADLRAFDWILIFAETLTVLPPGVTRRFREDFETILFSELNFRAEARHTNIFR